MTRARRLAPARDLAEKREQEAAAALASAQQAVADAERRMDDMRRFRDEYAQRLATAPGGGLSAVLLKETANFVSKVDGGMEQARRWLAEQQRLCELRHAEWVKCRVRTRAIGKLSQRHEALDSARAARTEQREQDEFASRGGR